MKAIIIIALLSIGNLFSQDLKCLDYKLYNSDYDAKQIENQTNSDVLLPEIDLKDGKIQLEVFPSSYAEFPRWSIHKRNGVYNGFKIILLNNSEEDYNLYNMDGRIIVYRQVFYKNEWRKVKSYNKEIQYRCGNSFFSQKIIYSKDHFTFIAPCLEGNLNVKFRFIIALKEDGEYTFIFSNEFDGYINKELIE